MLQVLHRKQSRCHRFPAVIQSVRDLVLFYVSGTRGSTSLANLGSTELVNGDETYRGDARSALLVFQDSSLEFR